MGITQGTADLIQRICKMVILASLLGSLMLWLTPEKSQSVTQVVASANYGVEILPILYPSFKELTSVNSRPFDFQKVSLRKRSFVVIAPPTTRKRSFETRTLPGPDTRGLRLLAIQSRTLKPKAMVQDASAPGIVTLGLGDMIRESLVTQIADTRIILTRNNKSQELGWATPWQAEVTRMIQAPRQQQNVGKDIQ